MEPKVGKVRSGAGESREGPAGEGTGRGEGVWEHEEEKLEEGRSLLGREGKWGRDEG